MSNEDRPNRTVRVLAEGAWWLVVGPLLVGLPLAGALQLGGLPRQYLAILGGAIACVGLILLWKPFVGLGRWRAGGIAWMGAFWLAAGLALAPPPTAAVSTEPLTAQQNRTETPQSPPTASTETEASAADPSLDQETSPASEPPPPQAIDTVRLEGEVGRWCDQLAPGLNREMTIFRRDGGGYAVRHRYTVGSPSEERLALSGNLYRVVGDDHGDRYQVGTSGELRLYDNEGYIRSAPIAGPNCLR